ncbi:Glutathione transport system permease protein gsiC [Anaerococcus prevotii]|uniref:Binding-protein-dependent transport systems inner membrane component n=1 Tax=Anaerococcus prevotii (strain ATCC 9321 / DSM 20548 / JCM 6508 / NCTC 11806 / PC1) TaxID=525919 RepID=C7RG26_ANAPD|nr:ABC transporter permease [Anaerococcus prevotii]ACV28437.1 binding-protein-dependent transport systems inner membrane component [Anaerococcus prevotii DSM 20548]SUU93996.1 Glutathione transport system permease protein gsiC [Anaerococcus prevotii]
MTKAIVKKLLSIILTLFFVSVLIFLVFQIIPGNPAEIILGTEADPAQIKALERELGLDKSMFQRYISWIGGLLRLDMGESLKYRMPVSTLFLRKLPVTLTLTLYSLILSIIIAIPLSIQITLKSDKWYSSIITAITQLGISIPSFWLAFLLIYVFAVKLDIFDTLSYNAMAGGFLQRLKSFFLPSLAIAIPNISTIIRYMQAAILDEINKDYVRTARMKGMTLKEILYKHVLKNALIPVITVIGMSLTSSVGGSLIIENVFALPGIGSLIVASISSRDFPLIQSVVIAVAFLVIFINFIIDIAYGLIDPRIRGGK